MACRISFDYGDCGADDTDAAIRVPGAEVPVLNGDGSGDLILSLSHVL